MELTLRPVTLDDEQLLLAWRNEEEVRRQFFSGDLVTPEVHARWLRAKLDDPASVFYIAELDGAPVGQARVDTTQDGEGEISVSVAPESRGRGLGKELIRAGSLRAMVDLALDSILALVKETNAASLGAFRAAGFSDAERVLREADPIVVLRLCR